MLPSLSLREIHAMKGGHLFTPFYSTATARKTLHAATVPLERSTYCCWRGELENVPVQRPTSARNLHTNTCDSTLPFHRQTGPFHSCYSSCRSNRGSARR